MKHEIKYVIIKQTVFRGRNQTMSQNTLQSQNRIKLFWMLLAITVAVADYVYFFQAPGTGDIRGYFVLWVDNVYRYGLRQGFIENANMYTPLSTFFMFVGSILFPLLENAQAIRAMGIILLLVSSWWIVYKYNKPVYGFLIVLAGLLSIQLGFIDVYLFPFLTISIYYLSKERYHLFVVFFTLSCCIKLQPFIIAPLLLLFFVSIKPRKPYICVPLKNVIQMSISCALTLLPLFALYGFKSIFDCIKFGLTTPGFSPNALNFIWIVQYFCELLFPDKTTPLVDGLPVVYWSPHGKMLWFDYIFWGTFVFLCIYTILLKKKTTTIILKLIIIEFTIFFLFKLGVHENHLILAMILTLLLLCLEDNLMNRCIFIFYAIVTNVNMAFFYGLEGERNSHSLLFGFIPNSVIISTTNTLGLLIICIYLFINIHNQNRINSYYSSSK